MVNVGIVEYLVSWIFDDFFYKSRKNENMMPPKFVVIGAFISLYNMRIYTQSCI